MPYYVYRITPVTGSMVRNLEKLNQFDSFREAKTFAREQRSQLEEGSTVTIKVMFAGSELEAEERLLEKREKPIVMEWEK
ncbi:MAG TPA: hypothetical protein ENJ01_06595 [Gammaproteobacteria bacterium]|nr:hypothetical protein [Gammaproteobacteria bacterium]